MRRWGSAGQEWIPRNPPSQSGAQRQSISSVTSYKSRSHPPGPRKVPPIFFGLSVPLASWLSSCNPGDHLKKCRSPGQQKCRQSASESAGPKRGASESAEKSAPGPRLLYYLYIGAEPGALFSAPSSAPRFGPALHFGTFPRK